MARHLEFRYGLLAEFESADAMTAAAARLRADGYEALETFAPFDLPEADAAVGAPPTRLGWLAGGAAIGAAAFAYWVQWWTNVRDYPLNVGGRPVHAVPAFVPVTFETAGLVVALVAFVGFLVATRLPRLWHPLFEVDGFARATDDRYWLGVDARDPRFMPGDTTEQLRALGPTRVVWVGGGA